MWRFDWHLSPSVVSCSEAHRLRKFVRDAIIPRLTDATTPDQFAAALASLERLKEQLLKDKKTFHFSSSSGKHYCIGECFEDLAASLQNQWDLRPKPAPPPAPRQPLRTPADVVRDLGEQFQPSPDEIPLGIDEPLDTE